MARILVVGSVEGLPARGLLQRLHARMRSDGHDATLLAREGQSLQAVRDADAVVAMLDGLPADGAAAIAYAHAQQKPVLGLTSGEPRGFLADACNIVHGANEQEWTAALKPFYESIKPFAGRLVRDRIPELVKEAGHEVKFRQLKPDEKPRFLKQKIANEAQELERADVSREKEEVADLLEALEAFIQARAFDRDDLRRVKEAKRKRRGGFERAFVVESTAADTDAHERTDAPPKPAKQPAAESAPARPEPRKAPEPKPATNPEPERAEPEAGFEYPAEESAPAVTPPENIGPASVESKIREL